LRFLGSAFTKFAISWRDSDQVTVSLPNDFAV
jgi:hypothetical protein